MIIIILLIIVIFVYIYKQNFSNVTKTLDAAVIVEPRNDPLLIPIVKDTISKLPEYTKFYIFHGTNNLEMLNKELFDYIQSGKVILINLNKENITVPMYSDMLTTSDFWNQIDGENILIFQTDSCICQYKNNDILYFLKDNYGYIGAPIHDSINQGNKSAQNGGFSLRKKSLMLKAVQTKKENENTFPEDIWFSVTKKDITNPAPFDIANNFSVETIFNEKPFGFHKPWNYLSGKNYTILKNNCPELKKIFNK
jgi:hypothetical protein